MLGNRYFSMQSKAKGVNCMLMTPYLEVSCIEHIGGYVWLTMHGCGNILCVEWVLFLKWCSGGGGWVLPLFPLLPTPSLCCVGSLLPRLPLPSWTSVPSPYSVSPPPPFLIYTDTATRTLVSALQAASSVCLPSRPWPSMPSPLLTPLSVLQVAATASLPKPQHTFVLGLSVVANFSWHITCHCRIVCFTMRTNSPGATSAVAFPFSLNSCSPWQPPGIHFSFFPAGQHVASGFSPVPHNAVMNH